MALAGGHVVTLPWSAGEFDEGLLAFRFLGGREVVRTCVMAVSRECYRLRFAGSIWKESCSSEFPHVAAAFEENPSWAPEGGTGGSARKCCAWYQCYRRLSRIPAALRTESLALVCPGCRQDMVPDLIKLFNQLLLFGGDRRECTMEVRAALPMFATAAGIAEVYSQDANSALPHNLFRQIVDETCQEYCERRSNDVQLHRIHSDDQDVVLRCEDFLELFSELLLGEAFQNPGATLVRSLRPWSTALTHNLIRRLCDPGDPCDCAAGEPPDMSVLQPYVTAL